MKRMILIIPVFMMLTTTVLAQHGGLGIKVGSPTYTFEDHPEYSKLINTLYISVRLSRQMTIFIDSYFIETEGNPFSTGLETETAMNQSIFSDKTTILGPMYHQNIGLFDLTAYGGVGFGWHSLRIGDKQRTIRETSKNHGAHFVFGLSYDLKKIPVDVFVEGRYARIFLNDEGAYTKFVPSPLHRDGQIDLKFISAGFLVYFF